MNGKYLSDARKLCVIILALQMGALAGFSQSDRARERASDNARFNRDNSGRGTSRAMTDSEFIQRAYAQNLAEMKIAHVAVDASRDPEIQKAGHRIINEQQRANDSLQKIADAKGITVSKELTQRDQAAYDRLSKLQGGEFDKAYRDYISTDYRQIVRMFRDAAQNATDTQLQSLASEYANLFEQHAETLGVKLGSAVASSSSDQQWDRSRDTRDYSREDSRRDEGRYSWDRNRVRDRDGSVGTSSSSTATSAGTRASSLGALSKTDEQLLNRAFRQSRMQVQAAQSALKNSKTANIRSLAQSIVTDHQQLNQDLRDLASNRGFTLPTTVAKGSEDSVVDNLEKLSGADFDRAYREYVTSSHRAALNLGDKSSTTDPDVRNFLSKYQSAAQQHMSMLR